MVQRLPSRSILCGLHWGGGTCLEGLHVKQVSDFGLTIPLLLQRRCKDMKKFMCVLRAEKPTVRKLLRLQHMREID